MTLPPSISVAMVTSETSLTTSPCSLNCLAVPPLAIRVKPWEERVAAKEFRDDLSETDRRAARERERKKKEEKRREKREEKRKKKKKKERDW